MVKQVSNEYKTEQALENRKTHKDINGSWGTVSRRYHTGDAIGTCKVRYKSRDRQDNLQGDDEMLDLSAGRGSAS